MTPVWSQNLITEVFEQKINGLKDPTWVAVPQGEYQSVEITEQHHNQDTEIPCTTGKAPPKEVELNVQLNGQAAR